MTGGDPSLAERLRSLRLAGGYAKARYFARELGISENRYTRYERGEAEPDFALLRTICTKLGATPNELFGWLELAPAAGPATRTTLAYGTLPGFAESAAAGDGAPSADAQPAGPPGHELAAWRLAKAFGEAGVGFESTCANDAPLTALRLTADVFLRLRQDPLPAVASLLQQIDVARLHLEHQTELSREIEAFVALLNEARADDGATARPAAADRVAVRRAAGG